MNFIQRAGNNVEVNERGRIETTPAWPNGGMVSKPMDTRNYNVSAFVAPMGSNGAKFVGGQSTGTVYSTVDSGRWSRGQLIRQNQVEFRPSRPQTMYDPTDPNTWPAARF